MFKEVDIQYGKNLDMVEPLENGCFKEVDMTTYINNMTHNYEHKSVMDMPRKDFRNCFDATQNYTLSLTCDDIMDNQCECIPSTDLDTDNMINQIIAIAKL